MCVQDVLDRVAALKATLQATMTKKAELEAQVGLHSHSPARAVYV
jgi:hypothetical protein